MATARFDAFISYSRGASASLAEPLQSAVERFAKPWYRLRALRLFRDDSSMSANTALWSTIEGALIEAEWLVLIASPGSAASEWVGKEVRWWLDHKDASRILLVLDEGTIGWDAAAGDFDWSETDALPRVLSKAFPEEPRWVDLSWFDDADGLGTDDPRWTERVADLAAAIRGQERDQLIGENVREHRSARRLLRGGITALAVLLVGSLIATVVAVVQSGEAQAQARVAFARQLAAQSLALASTDIQLASLLAVEAHRVHADEQTEAALFQVASSSPHLSATFQAGAEVTKVDASDAAGLVVAGTVDGDVLAWDRGTGESRALGALDGAVSGIAVDASGSVVVATRPGDTRVWVDGVETVLDTAGGSVEIDPEGAFIVVFGEGSTDVFRSSGAGFGASGSVEGGADTMAVSDGELVFADLEGWGRIDLETLEIVGEGLRGLAMDTQGIALSADGERLAVADGSVSYPVVGIDSGADVYDRPDWRADLPVAGPLAMALDDTGELLAVNVDDIMYVSRVREPLAAAEPALVLDGGSDARPNALSFVGSRYLVSASQSRVLLWDLEQVSRITSSLSAPVPVDCRACPPPVIAVAPDGVRAVAATRTGQELVLYDTGTGASLAVGDAAGAFSAVQAPSWFDDGRLAAYSVADQSLLVLSGAQLGEIEASVPLDVTGVLATRPLPDGTVGLLDDAGAWHVVDPVSGTDTSIETELAALAGAAYAVQISPDGAHAFAIAFLDAVPTLSAIDTATGASAYAGEATGAAFDGDSALIVVRDGRARPLVGSVGDGELGDGVPADVAALPPLTLSPDGRILVSGGLDGVVEFTDLRRWGSRLGVMAVPDEESSWVFSAFSPDGSVLVTAVQAMAADDYRSSLRVTDVTVDGWVEALCRTAGRALTEAEWARYSEAPYPEEPACVP